MPSSLKCQLKKLKYKKKITDGEYYALIKKLEGHDKRLEAKHEQIRCKDCKYSKPYLKDVLGNDTYKCKNELIIARNEDGYICVSADFYCADADRKEVKNE